MHKCLCLLVFGLLALVACTTETNVHSSQVSPPTSAIAFVLPPTPTKTLAKQALPGLTISAKPLRLSPRATPTVSRFGPISTPTATERPITTIPPAAVPVIFSTPVPTTPAPINTTAAPASATPVPATWTPTKTATASPSATRVLYVEAQTKGITNVQSEPTTHAATVFELKPHARIWLVARLQDSSWFLIQMSFSPRVLGWVSAHDVLPTGPVDTLKIYYSGTMTPVVPPITIPTKPITGTSVVKTPPAFSPTPKPTLLPLGTPPLPPTIPSPRATPTPPPVISRVITIVVPSPPTSASTPAIPTPPPTAASPTMTRTRTPIPPYPPPYP